MSVGQGGRSGLGSGLQDRASAGGSLEFMWCGAADGRGLPWVGVAAGADGAPDAAEGEAIGADTLMGSITGPWSGREIAARVPSALMAMGPSSGPSANGNGLRTPAVGFSQYHTPVPTDRTAIKPSFPRAAPSVKSAA